MRDGAAGAAVDATIAAAAAAAAIVAAAAATAAAAAVDAAAAISIVASSDALFGIRTVPIKSFVLCRRTDDRVTRGAEPLRSRDASECGSQALQVVPAHRASINQM
eukprot:6196251-Pleurochrysis_carterae.AAC.8